MNKRYLLFPMCERESFGKPKINVGQGHLTNLKRAFIARMSLYKTTR
jgi:hypothetical protein